MVPRHDDVIDVMRNCERWEVQVSEHGFVALVDVMPRLVPYGRTADTAIVQAARVSYGQGVKSVEEDRGLVRFLTRHRHTTPLEMCLHGDTRIPNMQSSNETQKYYTMRQLAEAFAKGGPENAWAWWARIRTVNADGKIESTCIRYARHTGRKMTYRVTEDSAHRRSIVATDNHPFLTPTGYKTLAELKVGDEILQNGTAVLEASDLQALWDRMLTLDEIANELGVCRRTAYKKLREAGVDTSRRHGFPRKNGTGVVSTQGRARKLLPKGNPCEVCNRSNAKDLHHKDKNPLNNALDNVMRVCAACHKALDGKSCQRVVYTRRILSIEPVGVDDVYDLEVESDNHNFVAEGFVVHNCEFKWHCSMPIFVARQWIRHRTAAVNEYSARYSPMTDKFWIPKPEELRAQAGPTANKQHTEGEVEAITAEEFCERVEKQCEIAFNDYQAALAGGVGRELARVAMPLCAFTEWYWKIDAHNLFHFLSLRMDKHAQKEIRDYADAMFSMVEMAMPDAAQAFLDYRLNAMTLSALEIEAVRSGQPLATSNKREQEEWATKRARLGL